MVGSSLPKETLALGATAVLFSTAPPLFLGRPPVLPIGIPILAVERVGVAATTIVRAAPILLVFLPLVLPVPEVRLAVVCRRAADAGVAATIILLADRPRMPPILAIRLAIPWLSGRSGRRRRASGCRRGRASDLLVGATPRRLRIRPLLAVADMTVEGSRHRRQRGCRGRSWGHWLNILVRWLLLATRPGALAAEFTLWPGPRGHPRHISKGSGLAVIVSSRSVGGVLRRRRRSRRHRRRVRASAQKLRLSVLERSHEVLERDHETLGPRAVRLHVVDHTP
mmetsp:Transcript_69729/g.156442  ORF Transcript_69729/g.156442 Transcript_69729/m.156442 type:complete len:282 (-) Transcript_69729:415-1260(-)